MDAADTFAKVVARVKEAKDDRARDFELLGLVRRQCDAGNVDGALEILQEIKGAYWKTLGYCTCAVKLVADGQAQPAQALLNKAETLSGAEPEPRNSTHLWEKIAEARAKADDLAAAHQCLRKALKISSETKDNDHHQGIARCQVRLGLFNEAYETILAIPQAQFRLLPLAELAHQVAKQEAFGRKKGVPK